ncbi:hypothetical protein KDA11_06260 [Candidatus Saccharibacteria bacterium]|nr:hypothetical protein [Candidatus Saccharibacteria bacterium]
MTALSREAFIEKYTKQNTIKNITCSHDFHFVRYMKPAVMSSNAYNKSQPVGGVTLARGRTTKVDITVKIDPSTSFLTDAGLYIKVKAPAPVTLDTGAQVRWRWCDYPGVRLIHHASCKYTQSDVDEYFYYDIMNETAVMTDVNTREAWNRCVGQDTGTRGKLYNYVSSADQSMLFFKGYQTLKTQQDDLELFIPLRFFWNKKIEDAFMATNLDFEQMEITLQLADLADMVEGIVDPVPPFEVVTEPTVYTDLQSLEINKLELWTNNIIVDECVHAVLQSREIYNIITIRKQFRTERFEDIKSINLDPFRFLVEDIIIHVACKDQMSGMETWWRDGCAEKSSVCGIAVLPQPVGEPIIVTRPYVGYSYTPIIKSASFTTKGTDVTNMMERRFFEDYIPFVRGQQLSGSVSLLPETHRLVYSWAQKMNDPSSVHATYNASREREVFFNYIADSSVISRSNPAEFIFTAHVKAVLISSCGTSALYFN